MKTKEIANENINFERILSLAIELPGVRINRVNFLQKELSKYFGNDVAKQAIETTPAQAGISVKELEKIAKACINYETAKVTAISTAVGMPGGFTMAATVPADIAQFFAHIIRILQKLIYLYGWQEMFSDDENGFDDETNNQLILFIGVMFGVNAASTTITKIAKVAALNAEKRLLQKALTKGTIYPIVKRVATIIGFKMTRDIFAKSIGKIIPVFGGMMSGGITFFGFMPMAKRLQKYLIDLPMARVEYCKCRHNNEDDIIDLDFSDIVVEDVVNFNE